jgi:hypothetical protein
MDNLTLAILMQMISEDNYVPYQRTARDFKKEKKPKDLARGQKMRTQKVNRSMRRNHNIKQPGFDVQRRPIKN